MSAAQNTPTPAGARRLLRPVAQQTYDRIFGVVYVGLMANLLLALCVAPLLAALAIASDPLASWPFFAVLSVLCAPALAGMFACFTALGEGRTEVLRPFWSAYRRTAGRALAVWALGAGAVSILAVDTVAVTGTVWGPLLTPFFATLAVLTAATVLAVITALAAPPPGRDPRLRELLWPCLCLVARRWYLAVANVALLGVAATAVLLQPVAGLLVACAPLLYVAWANTRYLLAPAPASVTGL
jgi:hypothetical protein